MKAMPCHPCRQLLADNGTFQVDNLNDWQHSTMYLGFVTSGVVDLLGHFTQRLPAGTEHVSRSCFHVYTRPGCPAADV